MYKAVIFDLNGVFLESEFLSARFKEKFGVDESKFIPALKQIMNIIRQPGAPAAYSLWEPYFKEWGVDLSEKQFFDFYFSGESLVSELVVYAQELKDKGLKVFILSNNFKERTEYYRSHFPEIFTSVDKAYFSWETGFVKPSTEAMNLVLSENNLNPSECIYFDDVDPNLEVARSLGVHAEKWAGLEAAKALLIS